MGGQCVTAETCKNCRFPLSSDEQTKYRDRCRWCGAPEWRTESERTAQLALAGAPYATAAEFVDSALTAA